MADDKSSLQPNFGLLDLINPLGSPQRLEGDQGVTNLVVVLHLLLVFLVLDEGLGELFHRGAAAEQQVA